MTRMSPETPGQEVFSAALLSPDAEVPQNIVDPQGRIAPKRFAVYRNNVTVSLIEALRASFPAVEALVGEAFFAGMARPFLRAHPPQSPLLMEYGRTFAAHVANFAPARGLPFLADVARLDRAVLDAFHAADAVPVGAAQMAEIDPQQLAGIAIVPHPALHLVPSAFPLVDIWRAGRAGSLDGLAPGQGPQWALVVRPDVTVNVLALKPSVGRFVRHLAAGDALGGAVDQALDEDPTFDLAAALGVLIDSGAMAAIVSGSQIG